jgi:hypothetical protein
MVGTKKVDWIVKSGGNFSYFKLFGTDLTIAYYPARFKVYMLDADFVIMQERDVEKVLNNNEFLDLGKNVLLGIINIAN